MKIIIKKADKSYINNIVDFQLKMALETENVKLLKDTVIKGVEAVFNDNKKGKYYIAKHNDKTIASLLTTYEWSDWRNAHYLWIQSLYVIKDYRNKGVFKQMYNYLKNIVINDNEYAGIRLYVDNTNTKAIEVYKKTGMDNNHYYFFEWLK
ncbi:MAG: GNAT family N-acetyltransferase [Bacteroidetes bacterium]|nr:MAG: GNAT family N-acetyltransferase [Bacteroidota bacterium]